MFDWDFVVFVGALSIAAFSPGPGLAALVATVLANGARRSIWFCVGIICGDLVWLSMSLSGLALIAQQIPAVFTTIKWAGVAYLVYLAVKLWTTPADAAQVSTGSKERGALVRILSGFSITMGNPKAMLFYLALLPSIVTPESLNASMVISLALAVIIVLGTVFAVYVYAAEKARSALTSAQSIRTFNRITGTALGGAAVWIAAK
ncbi:LysE family translocator [Sulfitobacter pacificus]|uniref:Lysine transporter LysE n=1 Tax=Sulfitobacter pacificus TaxID=1499314 RepID=A0ABQ5VNY4_9RHOB|nr:LysE family translocator [Sulfitobacter pacificus]GLQ28859.1 lysine transporter LysE [Sulfitobacter pacificus]|tara:strand:- start:1089 stop:1703 length:615 start_codon:yes stop_codon:yes gene_type:complete